MCGVNICYPTRWICYKICYWLCRLFQYQYILILALVLNMTLDQILILIVKLISILIYIEYWAPKSNIAQLWTLNNPILQIGWHKVNALWQISHVNMVFLPFLNLTSSLQEHPQAIVSNFDLQFTTFLIHSSILSFWHKITKNWDNCNPEKVPESSPQNPLKIQD